MVFSKCLCIAIFKLNKVLLFQKFKQQKLLLSIGHTPLSLAFLLYSNCLIWSKQICHLINQIMSTRTVQLSSLPSSFTKQELQKLFAKYGKVTDVLLQETNATIQFATQKEASDAFKDLFTYFSDRKVKILHHGEPAIITKPKPSNKWLVLLGVAVFGYLVLLSRWLSRRQPSAVEENQAPAPPETEETQPTSEVQEIQSTPETQQAHETKPETPETEQSQKHEEIPESSETPESVSQNRTTPEKKGKYLYILRGVNLKSVHGAKSRTKKSRLATKKVKSVEVINETVVAAQV